MAGTGIARSRRSKGRNKKLEVHIFNYKRDGVTTEVGTAVSSQSHLPMTYVFHKAACLKHPQTVQPANWGQLLKCLSLWWVFLHQAITTCINHIPNQITLWGLGLGFHPWAVKVTITPRQCSAFSLLLEPCCILSTAEGSHSSVLFF